MNVAYCHGNAVLAKRWMQQGRLVESRHMDDRHWHEAKEEELADSLSAVFRTPNENYKIAHPH